MKEIKSDAPLGRNVMKIILRLIDAYTPPYKEKRRKFCPPQQNWGRKELRLTALDMESWSGPSYLFCLNAQN